MLIFGEGWLTQVFVGGLQQTVLQLICWGSPFCAFALVLHWLERAVQLSLARQFGWQSVLWTGWLGTPIHECSHALFCLLFGHRVEEMALFRPDRKAGRLGYVKHSYNRKNPYHVVGNFFIGVAPLIGGTIVLCALLWIFYPAAAQSSLSGSEVSDGMARGEFIEPIKTLVTQCRSVITEVITVDHVFSWQFWLFLYLVLCVGSHLAPSASDYRGTRWGALLLLGILLLVNWIYLAFGGETYGLLERTARIFSPALALFTLCVVLCGVAALAVFGITRLVKYLSE